MKSSKTRKRFILVPDYVRSQNDNDVHYVGVPELLALYQCKIEECIVMGAQNHAGRDIKAYAMEHKLRILEPLSSGAYWPVDEPRLDQRLMKLLRGINKKALRHG